MKLLKWFLLYLNSDLLEIVYSTCTLKIDGDKTRKIRTNAAILSIFMFTRVSGVGCKNKHTKVLFSGKSSKFESHLMLGRVCQNGRGSWRWYPEKVITVNKFITFWIDLPWWKHAGFKNNVSIVFFANKFHMLSFNCGIMCGSTWFPRLQPF